MKRNNLAIFAGLLICCHAAQAEIYLCTDANGKKTYQNYGSSKGCKRLDIDVGTSIPAPSHSTTSRVNSNPAKPTAKTPSPKDFPTVSENQQFDRDKERRRIIEDELRNEEAKLANLKKEYNNGDVERVGGERNYAKYQERLQRMKDDLTRTEKNVETLKKELNTLPK